MTRPTRRTWLLGTAALAALATLPAAADVLKQKEIFTDWQGFAIKGYDTVAYHVERRAVKGSEAFQHTWKGAIWLFASAATRDRASAGRKGN